MKVCVLYAPKERESRRLDTVAGRFADGVRSAGNEAEVFNVNLEMGVVRPALFDHTVLISEPTGLFGGKVPPNVSVFLGSCQSLSGLKCSCYTTGACLRKQKTLQALMGTMESEGMFLRISDIIKNPDHAFAIGKRLLI